MRLFELQWEKVYKWSKGPSLHDLALYYFDTDADVEYQVKFKKMSHWDSLGLTAYDLSFKEAHTGEMSLTGTGDVVGVFATVADIAKHFVDANPQVDLILFTGVASLNKKTGKRTYGRIKFYTNRTPLLAAKLNMGYLIERSLGGIIDVYLTKNDKVKDIVKNYRGISDETV